MSTRQRVSGLGVVFTSTQAIQLLSFKMIIITVLSLQFYLLPYFHSFPVLTALLRGGKRAASSEVLVWSYMTEFLDEHQSTAPEASNISPSCCCCCVSLGLPPHPQLFLHWRLHTVTSKREGPGIDSWLRVVGGRKRNGKQKTPPYSGVKSCSGESRNQSNLLFYSHYGDVLRALSLRLKTRDR